MQIPAFPFFLLSPLDVMHRRFPNIRTPFYAATQRFYIDTIVGVTVTVTVACGGHIEADELIIGMLELMDWAAIEDDEDVLEEFIIAEEVLIVDGFWEVEGDS